jgi:hypothetical protein
MHCPKCGQEQIAEDTRFCSRCGFLLTGIAQVVASDGMLPGAAASSEPSPRRRGVMKGIFIFLLSFLIVPILAVISIALEAEPIAVFLALFLLTVGGFLRIAYAVMFESPSPNGRSLEEGVANATRSIIGKKAEQRSLPSETSVPVGVYSPPSTGKWLDTNELSRPAGSVTDSTTKLLEADKPGQ